MRRRWLSDSAVPLIAWAKTMHGKPRLPSIWGPCSSEMMMRRFSGSAPTMRIIAGNLRNADRAAVAMADPFYTLRGLLKLGRPSAHAQNRRPRRRWALLPILRPRAVGADRAVRP